MEISDDILLYMCDITDISYTKYFRLINKSMHDHVSLKYKIYKMVSFIRRHFANEHLNMMYRTGLIIHTNKLKSKIHLDKESLLKNLHLIKNEHLCTYLTQYFEYIQVTTHSVILNLL